MLPHKLLCINTVPISLHFILEGQLQFINQQYETIEVSSRTIEELKAIAKPENVEVKKIEISRICHRRAKNKSNNFLKFLK